MIKVSDLKVGNRFKIMVDSPGCFARGLRGDIIELIEQRGDFYCFNVPSKDNECTQVTTFTGNPHFLEHFTKVRKNARLTKACGS